MDSIDVFIDFLGTKKGQSEGTRRTHSKMMRKLLRLVVPFNYRTLSEFVDKLIVQKAAPSYIKQHVSLIRQWGECFNDEQLRTLPYPKIRHQSGFQIATFADHEVKAFLELKNPYTKTHKRSGRYRERYDMWIMFYSILFFHGLRTIEVARLEVNMIDFGQDILVLPARITKTRKPRNVPISKLIRDKLYIFVNHVEGDFLFPPFHESAKLRGVQHVGQADWSRFFKLQLQRLGIKRTNLRAYSGRHTYCTRQAEEGVPLKVLQEIMGHDRITTTEKYIHVGLKALRSIQDNDRIRRVYLPKKARYIPICEDIRQVFSNWNIDPLERKKILEKILEVGL